MLPLYYPIFPILPPKRTWGVWNNPVFGNAQRKPKKGTCESPFLLWDNSPFANQWCIIDYLDLGLQIIVFLFSRNGVPRSASGLIIPILGHRHILQKSPGVNPLIYGEIIRLAWNSIHSNFGHVFYTLKSTQDPDGSPSLGKTAPQLVSRLRLRGSDGWRVTSTLCRIWRNLSVAAAIWVKLVRMGILTGMWRDIYIYNYTYTYIYIGISISIYFSRNS